MRFFHIKKRLAVAAVVLSGLSACSPALDWREVRLEGDGGLMASFPCKPEHHQRTIEMAGWPGPLAVGLWSCEAGGATWALSRVQVAQPEQARTLLLAWPRWTRGNLEAAARQLPVAREVQAQDAEVRVQGMTPWPEARAWHWQTERADASGRPLPVEASAWHFAHGLSVFQAAVWRAGASMGGAKGEDVANAYFQSFQFRP